MATSRSKKKPAKSLTAKASPEVAFMKRALLQAKVAAAKGEVPIGALVVINGLVVATGHNLREKENDPTSHCEIIAIRRACRKLGDWRLSDAELYVTVQPCLMCYAVISQSRIKKVVYGCANPKHPKMLRDIYAKWPNGPKVMGGVLEIESAKLLSQFFKELRV